MCARYMRDTRRHSTYDARTYSHTSLGLSGNTKILYRETIAHL